MIDHVVREVFRAYGDIADLCLAVVLARNVFKRRFAHGGKRR